MFTIIAAGVSLLYNGARSLYNHLTKDLGARQSKEIDFQLPRVADGAPIPLFWGTVRIKSPLLAHAFGQAYKQDSSGVDRYYSNFVFVLGIPRQQVSSTGTVSLLRVWSGESAPNLDAASDLRWDIVTDGASSGCAFYSSGPGLDPQSPAGAFAGGHIYLYGPATTMVGEPIRVKFADLGEDASLFPDYKGSVKIALMGNESFDGDSVYSRWVWTGPEIPDPISFEIIEQAYVDETSAPSYHKIIDASQANPIGVIYDILTSDWGKLGIDTAKIDSTSFLAAGTTMITERHGLSLVVYEELSAQELIQEIVNQIGAVLYDDPATGKITIALIRDDYVAGDQPLIDESVVLEPPSLENVTWPETYNQVRVVFTDRTRDYTSQTAIAQDLANIAAQGKVRSIEYSFPGITHPVLAAQVAARELRQVSIPLKRLRLVVDRSAYALRPGGLFRFTWADYGISAMVFRISSVDLGMLEDGRIILEAIQDVYSVASTVNDALPPYIWVEPTTISPPPVAESVIQEAPRWIQDRARAMNYIADATQNHLLYLAVPNSQTDSFKGVASDSGNGTVQDAVLGTITPLPQDTQRCGFSGYAAVETAYSRSLDPYDTTTGLRIDGLTGVTLASASTANMAAFGANLALVGDELIAFETVTDIGGGVWRLNNVWRGLLDTPATAHAVDERVFFLSASGWVLDGKHVGVSERIIGQTALANIVPIKGAVEAEPTLIDSTSIVIAGRAGKPYPAADFELDASKAITALQEDGIDGTWLRRDYSASIERGDAADDSATGYTYRVYASRGDFAETEVSPSGAAINAASVNNINLAKCGHGAIDVSLRTISGSLTSWADPTIRVDAEPWRNLLINPRFETPVGRYSGGTTEGWTVTDGLVTTGSTSALGGAGFYVKHNGDGAWTISQTVDVSGYGDSGEFTAFFSCYTRSDPAGDTEDLDFTFDSLDVDDVVVDTQTLNVVPSTTQWDRQLIKIAGMAGAAKLKITIAATTSETNPSGWVTECALRLGQVYATQNEILNPSFASGLTSWTTAASGITTGVTTTLYEGAEYIQGNDAAFEIYQDVTPNTGWQAGSIAHLEVATMCAEAALTDTAEIVLEARNAGGLLTSTTTGAITLATQNIWERKTLSLDLPFDTTTVRVRLIGTAVGDSVCDIAYDDVIMFVHKQLEPLWSLEADFAAPTPQYMPKTISRWWQDFQVQAPTTGLWDGSSLTSQAPNSPIMINNGATLTTALPGGFDYLSHCETTAFETASGDISTMHDDHAFANFSTLRSFCAAAFIRLDPASLGSGCQILGRLATTRGWGLEVLSDGTVKATLKGALATITATSTRTIHDGGLHFVAIHYNEPTDVLRVIVDGTEVTASTVGVGESRVFATKFRIGRSTSSGTLFQGQIARVYLWQHTAAESILASIASIYTHGSDPSGLLSAAAGGITSGEEAAFVVKGSSGILVSRMANGQYPIAYGNAASAWGLAISKGTSENRASMDFTDGAAWVNSGCTVTQGIRDVEGFLRGVTLTGTNSNYFTAAALALDATADTRITFFVKGTAAANMRVELRNTSGVLKDTEVVAVTTAWKRIDLSMTWDDSTANAELWFYPSDTVTSRTITLSSPILIHQSGAYWPTLLPCRGASPAFLTAVSYRFSEDLSVAPAKNLSFEGEIVAFGVCDSTPAAAGYVLDLHNAVDNDSRRTIEVTAGGLLEADYYDAAGSATTSEVTPTGGQWAAIWQARSRWCYAGCRDTGTFAYLYLADESDTVNASDNDVASAVSAELTNVLARLEIGSASGGPANALINRVEAYSREDELWPGSA